MENIFFAEEKVFSFMERYNMIQPGDVVVAGISGGADSVCLLFMLLAHREKVPFSIQVVHVNHGIRNEAGEDEAYVERLCRENGLPFFAVHKNIPELSRSLGCSEEEAGRRARYETFRKIAQKTGAEKIAVAHNMNDCCETMLFHLFRGTGIRGLSGIRPKKDGIIRPILCLERREIEAYLEKRGIPFCRDATNETDDYTRNRIRHHILSVAEKEIAPGCVARMAQAADRLAEVEDYLSDQTLLAEERGVCITGSKGEFIFSVEAFQELHPVIAKRLLYKCLTGLSPHGKDISSVHVEMLLELFKKSGNRMIRLPFDITARREYGNVILYAGDCKQDREPPVRERDVESFPFAYEEYGLRLRKIPFMAEKEKVPQKKYTKWFDYDKIEKSLTVRSRRIGDYIMISDGSGGERHQSLKDYFINEKVPAAQRDQVLLIADGQHILWVVGYRISEHYKVTADTKTVLEAEITTG